MTETKGLLLLGGQIRLRWILVMVLIAQLLVPTAMLGLRIDDPTRGQMPFGWQMHSTCWGSDTPACN